ncbi:MAG TPA: SDR family NAD(P)-dependent oxidoreductase [Polyangiaceae bacterium]|nr:SDR family NAD(P)-dependent oxidoreductase [Polyangiaceae bacterium]
MSDLRFDGRVAIVTGAGNGLGRSHALLLASRGAKVVVNDLGGGHTGGGKSSAAADKVVEEIKAAGGEAVANYDSVEDGANIVKSAVDAFGKVDIVINNAGILRDVSFQKMTQEDWDLIYRVHVLGAYRVTKAAWDLMRDQGFGRVVFTASAAGIYGNFGQANYSMAKLGIHGFAQTLALEGKKKNVLVNTIAPIAGSRMTETVLPKDLIDALKPEYVTPLVAYLCHESNEETGSLFEVGGGFMGKLRWERSEGKVFKLGRDITPDAVKKAFSDITSFEKSTHPTDITSSMQPILGNLGSKSLGGNEHIDVDAALGYAFPEQSSSYDERDLALYALGIGHGKDPNDESELQYVYEGYGKGFVADPTFAVIPCIRLVFENAKKGVSAPGLNYGFDRILHGEQYTSVKRPLPPNAKLTHRARVKDIFDKGKNGVVVMEVKSFDESGEELIHNELTTVVRGAGGWGGDRGPSVEVNVVPSRAPDAVIEEQIGANQTLLYRLSGDTNPLHVDPEFAKAFGFPKPILHGLCTFGFAGRHVIKAFAGNDPRFFKSIKVRFSESVFPGETLVTEMWKESDEKIIFRCKVKERDKVCISAAAVELYKEIPKAVAKGAKGGKGAPASAQAAAAPSGEPTSAEIVEVIKDHVAKNVKELTSNVNASYVFNLTNPASAFSIDLRQGQGSVAMGAMDKPDCTLELTDSDFLDMTSGKADPQKLYFGGKLKISGNVMASQKLTFLKKIDPAAAKEVVAKLRGAGGAGAAAGAASAGPADTGAPTSADGFAVIGDHVAKNPDLAAKIGHVFVFALTSPDSAWTVDLKNGKGAVSAGAVEKADCTLTLSDSDFLDMMGGKADPQKLYFGGKLKITGNVMASQKLEFLKKIDAKAAEEAVRKARAAGAPKAAAPVAQSAREAAAGKVFAALTSRLASTPGLVAEVGAVLKFHVTSPDAVWTVDLKNGAGAVTAGAGATSDATLTLADEDLERLAKGEDPRGLFQLGRLRIDGDVRAAKKIGFLKQLA